MPLTSALPSINTAYKTSVATDGTGAPNVSGITTFTIDWDLTNNGLYQFSLNLNVSPYYSNFSPANTFGAASPGFTLTGSGITGLDGAYYINATATECDGSGRTAALRLFSNEMTNDIFTTKQGGTMATLSNALKNYRHGLALVGLLSAMASGS